MVDESPKNSSVLGSPGVRVVIGTLALAGGIGLACIYFWFLYQDSVASAAPWMIEAFRAHPGAILGIPSAAMTALVIVLFLEFKSGNIEFEIAALKFLGAV